MLRLPGSEGLSLERVEWSIELPGLPPACDGLSLLHITDLHFAPCYTRRYFDLVAEEAARWPADLVVFTGDLMDHEIGLEWAGPVLSRLKGDRGTFSILGNHDYGLDAGQVREALSDAGFEDLDGRWTTLDVRGATVAIGGTSAPWGPRLDVAGERDADLRIVLSHSPDFFFEAVAGRIDLVLAGHNHGGQIRLPMVGPIIMPSWYGRRFDRGWFRRRGTSMYVSQGIGGKHPVRYGCRPEITRIVLRSPGMAHRVSSRASRREPSAQASPGPRGR